MKPLYNHTLVNLPNDLERFYSPGSFFKNKDNFKVQPTFFAVGMFKFSPTILLPVFRPIEE